MTARAAVRGTAAALLLTIAGVAPASRADAPGPLYALVDAAAQRLQTADAVAAVKWITKGAIEDPVRERQVIDAVTTAATALGIDPGHVQRIFQDQIDATVGIEYARFSTWKLDPAGAPATAPDLTESRTAIDALNHVMVNELAAQRDSLLTPECGGDVQAARDAVATDRKLDGLYRDALSSATRSYCR